MNFIKRVFSFDEFRAHGVSAERKLRGAFLFTLICLGAIGIMSYLEVRRVDHEEQRARNTAEAISSMRLILSHITDGETGQRGYDIVGDESYLEPYREAQREIEADFGDLRKLTAFNVEQQRLFDSLVPLVEKRMSRMAEEIEIRRRLGFAAAQAATVSGVGKRLHDRIRGVIGEMETAEQTLLRQRESEVMRGGAIARRIVAGGSVLALCAVAMALISAEKDFARRRAHMSRLALAGRLSRMGAWAVEVPGFRQTWSDEVFNILEMPPGLAPTVEESINLYAPEFRETVRAAFEACVREGTPFDVEVQVITTKDRRVWVRNIGEAERDRKGVVRRVHGALQDISEQKLAMEALQRQQAELRVLFDLMPALIWFKDTKNVVLRVNQTAADAAGRSVEEIEGKSAQETYPRDSAKFYTDDLEVIGSRAPKIGFVEQFLDRDGKERWFQTDKVPVFDKDGKVAGLVVMARDITAAKRTDDNVQRLAAIVENSADAIVGLTVDGIVTSWNPAAEKMFGYSAPDIIGLQLRVLVPPDRFDEEKQSLAALASGELVQPFETVRIRKNGQHFDVSATISPIKDSAGRIVGISKFYREITERKRAELQLREQNEILSRSHEGMVIVTLDNKVSFWNRGAEEIFGWTAADALGRAPEQMLGFDEPEGVRLLREAIEREEFWNGELPVHARDGRKLVVACRSTLVKDQAGRPRARLAFLSDITERKKLEEQLLHLQRLECVGMLAAGIAHDLNNVLAPIMFVAPLLRNSLSSERDMGILNTLEQSAVRGAGLVRQILGFVHKTMGEFQPTQFKHVATDIVSVIEQTFPKSIQVRSKISADLWQVLGEATQLHQVLLNLCVNARDAMPQGGTLRIGAANRRLNAAEAGAIAGALPGVYIVVEVADTGIGIPPEILDDIWTPFYTTKGPDKGTGLGLSTIRGIVSGHHGFIELHTEVGRGTTFRVFLPAIELESLQPSKTLPFAAPQGQGELILVVDDDPLIRDMITAALEKHGYRVICCSDGMEAIGVFTAHLGNFSIVVTDVDMPRLGGVALAQALLMLRPEIRLLVISGLSRSAANGIDVAGIQAFAHAFLLKPFKVEELLGTVHHLLHSPQES